jgi:diaminohydroxyphosphoribosylaminopyrimidine deaminase/5-amino-6-(5-phosphoribosylamino)uracil reductase
MQNSFFMQQAINEALKADPKKVYPNPMVGCVIVLNDKIIGRGYHKAFGTKHAEVNAIESLKAPVRDADLYVTLEPCAHFGNNPPCVDAIIKSKMFKKVIIAVADPNKKAMGGIDELKKANIEVEYGDSQIEAKKINQRFFTFFENKRPYIILKYARTQDGFIAHSDGSSKWITEEDARRDVHLTRSGCDGILVGRNTIEQDNPSLDSHGLGKDPRIVILSSNPLSSSLKVSKKNPLVFQNLNKKSPENNIKIILDNLFKENVQSLLVEGGEKTITSFIQSGYYDEIHEYISPKKFNEGIPFYSGDFDKIRSSLDLVSEISFNSDIKKTYKKKCLQD